MLSSDFLTPIDNAIHSDTREFLDRIMLALLNILLDKGIDTNAVEFLGTNDVAVFRGTNVAVFSFSRSRKVLKPCLSELSLAEVIEAENIITVEQPIQFNDVGISKLLTKEAFNFASPVSVCIPISYLSLSGDDLKGAHNRVADLLVQPCEEDVDRKNRIVRVNPIYSGRDFLLEPYLCFVLLEFQPPYTAIFDHLIKPAVEDEGFTCLKSDDIFSTTSVIEDIWANINKAALIIAEISTNNPNVMYELGISHTIGKNVMMITQQPDEIPFNFRHLRCYPYKNDIPGSDGLRKNIKSVIQNIKATLLA